MTPTAIADGNDLVQRKAAADANAVQDAVNLVAIVGCFHRHLLALSRSGTSGDDLINHPVSLAFVSKLNSDDPRPRDGRFESRRSDRERRIHRVFGDSTLTLTLSAEGAIQDVVIVQL